MTKKFQFTSWVYRDITVYSPNEVDRMVDCGLTLPMVPSFNYKDPEHVEMLKGWLERASARGVKLILDVQIDIPPELYEGDQSWVEEIRNFYRVTLNSHPAVYGFTVGDEPITFYELALTKYKIIKLKEALPELTPYMNFAGQTGVNVTYEAFGGMTHDEYLKSITDKAGYFAQSYDMYSQLINNTGGTDDYFRENMKNVDASEKAGIEPWACLICSAHNVYRIPSEYDIVWQISTAAACGYKGICWFRFYDSPVVPNYHGSPVDEYGESTIYYDHMKRSIRRFQDHYGEIFPKLKRKATYFFGEDRKRGSYPRFEDGTHDVLEHVRVSWEESLISFFEHEETGEEYFCVVNISREHPEHYEFFFDYDKYDIHEVYANGKRGGPVGRGPRDEAWEDNFLYPGQLGLFKIIKK